MRRFGEAVLAASPAQARPLLAQALPDPHHDLANRVVFRMSPAGGSLLSVPALQWLDQPATQLAAPFGELVKGRVVIIGQTHSGAADFFQTPLGEMAGAIVLANAIDSMQAFGQLGQPSPLVMAAVSLLLIVVWAMTGPLFHYSDTWQLIINTGTTIVTFLMVFLIQNTQNRDGAAIQAKLDELIRASAAQNAYIGIEHLTEEELDVLRARCEARARFRMDLAIGA